MKYAKMAYDQVIVPVSSKGVKDTFSKKWVSFPVNCICSVCGTVQAEFTEYNSYQEVEHRALFPVHTDECLIAQPWTNDPGTIKKRKIITGC